MIVWKHTRLANGGINLGIGLANIVGRIWEFCSAASWNLVYKLGPALCICICVYNYVGFTKFGLIMNSIGRELGRELNMGELVSYSNCQHAWLCENTYIGILSVTVPELPQPDLDLRNNENEGESTMVGFQSTNVYNCVKTRRNSRCTPYWCRIGSYSGRSQKPRFIREFEQWIHKERCISF